MTALRDWVSLEFEWDEEKNAMNRKKHGIDFRDAALVFKDENYLEFYDANIVMTKTGTISSGRSAKSSLSCTRSERPESESFQPE